ncbi:hypothetical protein E2P81_ATG04214 [Venturia nashicola]|nr:hypothetical protein E2P81_ATG04214 [Venturia nashicola]
MPRMFGNKLRIKAKECQQWLIEPDLENRGTVCLPTIKYSKMLWKMVKSKAKKHQDKLTEEAIVKLPATLMTIPRELRQQILFSTYELDDPINSKALHSNRFHDYMQLRAQHIRIWALKLRKIHPEINLDMDFVQKAWELQLHKIQAQMTDEFNYVWDNILFEPYTQLTMDQILSCQTYRKMFVEMGVLADKLWWEANHPVLKYLRRIPGLRRHIGVDTRTRMVWRHLDTYICVAWHIMNVIYDDSLSYSSSTTWTF